MLCFIILLSPPLFSNYVLLYYPSKIVVFLIAILLSLNYYQVIVGKKFTLYIIIPVMTTLATAPAMTANIAPGSVHLVFRIPTLM